MSGFFNEMLTTIADAATALGDTIDLLPKTLVFLPGEIATALIASATIMVLFRLKG